MSEDVAYNDSLLAVAIIRKHLKVFRTLNPSMTMGELIDRTERTADNMEDEVQSHFSINIDSISDLVLEGPIKIGRLPARPTQEDDELQGISGLRNAFSSLDNVYYWEHPEMIAGMINHCEKVYSDCYVWIDYEPDDELISLKCGNHLLFSTDGREHYDKLRELVKPERFCDPLKIQLLKSNRHASVKHGFVDIQDTISRLESIGADADLRRFISLPKPVKIERLFDAFYGRENAHDHYWFRFEGNQIYLTYKEIDLVSYCVANISWPHLKGRKKGSFSKKLPTLASPKRGDRSCLPRFKMRSKHEDQVVPGSRYSPLLGEKNQRYVSYETLPSSERMARWLCES